MPILREFWHALIPGDFIIDPIQNWPDYFLQTLSKTLYCLLMLVSTMLGSWHHTRNGSVVTRPSGCRLAQSLVSARVKNDILSHLCIFVVHVLQYLTRITTPFFWPSSSWLSAIHRYRGPQLLLYTLGSGLFCRLVSMLWHMEKCFTVY